MRSWIGFFLLGTLLLTGLFVQKEMESLHRPIARMLEQAAEYGQAENWEEALPLSAAAERRWRSAWKFSTAFADHSPMEDIDSLFARLAVHASRQDAGEFAAGCRELARRVDAMADAHCLNWQNLL